MLAYKDVFRRSTEFVHKDKNLKSVAQIIGLGSKRRVKSKNPRMHPPSVEKRKLSKSKTLKASPRNDRGDDLTSEKQRMRGSTISPQRRRKALQIIHRSILERDSKSNDR